MSSPHYPQSNGFIERTIQTVKQVLKKAKVTSVDPELALLCIRSTPINNQIGSPANLLYGRTIRSNLPLRTSGQEDTLSALKQRQEDQRYYYNRSAKDRPEMQIGQTVGLQDPKTLKWMPGRIVDKCDEPRSYIVQTPNGSRLRRNQRFLKDLATPRLLDQTPASPQPAIPQSEESERLPQIPEIDSSV